MMQVLVLIALLQCVWSAAANSNLMVKLVPDRTEITLLPNEWTTQSVLVCSPSFTGINIIQGITLYDASGDPTPGASDSELNAPLDYFTTRNRGYTMHTWQTNANAEGLICEEIIARLFNNQTLSWTRIVMRVTALLRGNLTDHQVMMINVTFMGEPTMPPPTTPPITPPTTLPITPPTTPPITTPITSSTKDSNNNCGSPSLTPGGLGTTPTTTVIGVVVAIVVVALAVVFILGACILATRNRRNRTDQAVPTARELEGEGHEQS